MAIANPESDINLWITIVSQSIPMPEQLLNCKQQIEQVISDVYQDEKSFSEKYRISPTDFYHSIYRHVLIPLLQLTEIQSTDDCDTFSLISDILISFLNLSYLYLTNDEENIREMLLLLFRQDNDLYHLNSVFYQTICVNFLDLGYYVHFLNYIEKISQMPQTLNSPKSNQEQTSELSRMMKKLPVLSKIVMKMIPLVEQEPDFEFKTFCLNMMKPLLLFPKYSSDSIAFDILITISDQISFQKYFDREIFKFWLDIFQAYLLTGSFSLILFSIRSMNHFIQDDFFREKLLDFLQKDEFQNLVKLYMNVQIRSEFSDFLKVIYSFFLENSIIDVDNLLPIWEARRTSHISVRPAFYSIFEMASEKVPIEKVEKFTKMVLSNIQLSKEWLNFVVKCASQFCERNVNFSEYVAILKKVKEANFDFVNSRENLSENEIVSYKEIAENGLCDLLINSFNSTTFSEFLNSISVKIQSKKETEKDMQILCQSLLKFSNSKIDIDKSFLQQFLNNIVSAFNRHNINLMEDIFRTLINCEPYGCQVDQLCIKRLLSLTSNENICSNVYSFLTELCLALNQIPVDFLLQEMMTGNCILNESFYKTIKSIILNLNNGYDNLTHFPFVKEEVLWHFCNNDSKQILRFQHFLSRIYMRSKTSDEEMIQSFLTNWINGFKMFYHDKRDEEDEDETVKQFFDFLKIFLKKIEYYTYTPIQYHFSQYKTYKTKIQIETVNGEVDDYYSYPFYFDQRRSIASLIQYIKIRFDLSSDLEIYYGNQYLSRNISFEDEVGIDILSRLKRENRLVFISIKEIQFDSNSRKKNYCSKPTRTSYPSRFIVDKFKGIIEILLNYKKYHPILYFLPTFNENLISIKNMKNDDFTKIFPYNNANRFRYNFEVFLDYFSDNEFNLRSNERAFSIEEDLNSIFANSFVRKSGIIDYFISCGLSMTDETLVNMILSFLRDYSIFNPEISENEILNDQLLNMIQQYIEDPKSISKSTIETVFTFKMKSIQNLTKQQLYQLFIENKDAQIKEGAREFLRNVYVPLSFYSYTYDESKYEPREIFYFSYGDHILLSNNKDSRTNEIILCNLKKTNATQCYLYCIESALKRNMFPSNDVDTIAFYIASNFVNDQINLPPKPGFNSAIKVCSILPKKIIYDAFDNLFNSIEKFDLLANYLFCNNEDYEDDPMFDGDNLYFRQYEYDFKTIKLNHIEYPIGLKNLGATCYINAIVQQLFNINDFRNKLNSLEVNDQDENCNLVVSLNELFVELEESYLEVANPTKFINYFGVDVKIHNDCCEFLIQLIDRLGIDLFNCKFKHIISAVHDQNLSVVSFEDFVVLPLSIRGISNIDESIDHLFEVDYFTGDNGYIFDGIKKKVDAKKSSLINSLSGHLIIQLERFEYNHHTQEREKISSFFEFGDLLFINDHQFTLTGVIVHLGESAESGHYISYVRKQEVKSSGQDEYTNNWFQYNDSTVTAVSQDSVMEDGYENGYLLFYTEFDTDSIDRPNYGLERIDQLNKESTVCRMIYSKSLFNVVLNMTCDVKNIERFRIGAHYFFKFLYQYDNADYQEKFCSTFLSVVKAEKPIVMNVILNLWDQLSFENPLLFARWKQMRFYTCEVLKAVVDSTDCFEQLKKVMVNSIDRLYNLFYSSNEFFDLINHALHSNSEKMIKIIHENEIYQKLVSLFVKICVNRNSIEFQCTELKNFFEIFIQIGANDEIENAVLDNIDVFESFLNSATPIDSIVDFVLSLNRKDEVIALLGENEGEMSDKMLILYNSCIS